MKISNALAHARMSMTRYLCVESLANTYLVDATLLLPSYRDKVAKFNLER